MVPWILQVDMLVYLSSVAKGASQKVEVLIQVISSLFDINPSLSTHIPTHLWKRCAPNPPPPRLTNVPSTSVQQIL